MVEADLRALAKGVVCFLHLRGCRSDTAYTVLAHLRKFNAGGERLKPPDTLAIPACDRCHDILDGRIREQQHGYTRREIDTNAFRALVQWHDYLWRRNYRIGRAD